MSTIQGKHALMEALRAERVHYVFGNPGTSESPIMDALESFPDMQYVLVMQEGVAMGMADAYARATRKPAFVNLHIETGLANGISLLNNAAAGGTPLVLSAGNKDIRELAHGRTDLVRMVEQFTKWSAEATHPEQVPYFVRRAFNEAKTPPTGPTFISFSANALDGEADMDIVASPATYARVAPDPQAIKRAARVLADSSNPMMIIGDRVADSQATAEAVRVAEILGARVYESLTSEVAFPTSHPQFVGALRLGYETSYKILSTADAVLMVGKLLDGYYMFSKPTLRYMGPETKLVHLDSDQREVGSTQPTDVGIVSDPKTALVDLAEALDDIMSGADREAAQGRALVVGGETRKAREAWQHHVKQRWDASPMSAERMMAEIAAAVPADTIITDDSVTSRPALRGAMDFDEPGSVFGGRGGALGWGIGGGMGVKLANPNRPVIAVLGDGSAMMTIQGLWTAAAENIPVVYIICNNGSYRVLKINMNAYKQDVGGEKSPRSQYIGMDFAHPLDIAGMANAMGVSGTRVENPADIQPAVKNALDSGKPAVIDVVIDGSV